MHYALQNTENKVVTKVRFLLSTSKRVTVAGTLVCLSTGIGHGAVGSSIKWSDLRAAHSKVLMRATCSLALFSRFLAKKASLGYRVPIYVRHGIENNMQVQSCAIRKVVGVIDSGLDRATVPFLMFKTLNSCRRKLVCAKILPSVGKNLSWCALLPNFKKNQKRKLVSSQIRLVHFPIRGGNFGVLQRHKSTVYSRSFDMSRSTDGAQ